MLLVLLIIVDRAGAAIAGRTAASALQRSENLSRRPDVTIEGFPFLTQAASGNFDRIKVTARDITLTSGGAHVRVSRLDVTLHHVHVNRDFSGGTSRSSTATALVTYSDLSQALESGGRTLGSPATWSAPPELGLRLIGSRPSGHMAADDHVVTPYAVTELIAFIHALLHAERCQRPGHTVRGGWERLARWAPE